MVSASEVLKSISTFLRKLVVCVPTVANEAATTLDGVANEAAKVEDGLSTLKK